MERQAVPARSTPAASTSPTRDPITRSIVEQARAAIAEADLVLFVVDARAGRHAGRRGARADPARVAEAGARAREQDRRPGAGARSRSSSTASASATRSRSRACTARTPATCSTRSSRGSPGDVARARCRRRGDPRRDPRPAERRQVVALQRARRRRAHDRLRGAGHDARHDRHGARARRPHVPARRHRRPAPQAQAAAGDRVLLGAARARGGRARRRRARPDRREPGDRRGRPRRRRRRAQGAVLDAGRALEVGHLARSRSRRSGPELQRRLRQRPPFITISSTTGRGISRLLDKVAELYDKHASRIPTAELNRFLGELQGGAPAAVEGRPAA